MNPQVVANERLGRLPRVFLAVLALAIVAVLVVARFARGELAGSWRANPAGSLLAPSCLALVPWLLVAAVRGRPDPFRTWEAPLVGWAVAVVALTVFFWTLRMTLGGG